MAQTRSNKQIADLIKKNLLSIGQNYYYKMHKSDTRTRNVQLLDTGRWKYQDEHGDMKDATSISDVANALRLELDVKVKKKPTGENGWDKVYFQSGPNKDKTLNRVLKPHRDITKKKMKKKRTIKKKSVCVIQRNRNDDIVETTTENVEVKDDTIRKREDEYRINEVELVLSHKEKMLKLQQQRELLQGQYELEYMKKNHKKRMRALDSDTDDDDEEW
jgi:hypothetical protein